MDQLINPVHIEVWRGQLAPESEIPLLEMPKVKKQWHVEKLAFSMSGFGPGRSCELQLQGGLHMVRDKSAHVAAETRNLLDDPRTQKSVSVFGHHKNGFDPFV